MSLFTKKKKAYRTSTEISSAIVDSCQWKLASSSKYVMKVGLSTFTLVGTNNVTYLYLNDQMLVSSWNDMMVNSHKEDAKEAIRRFITQFTYEIDKKPI